MALGCFVCCLTYLVYESDGVARAAKVQLLHWLQPSVRQLLAETGITVAIDTLHHVPEETQYDETDLANPADTRATQLYDWWAEGASLEKYETVGI